MSDQLRHRFQQWEAIPPPEAWSAISIALKDMHAEQQLLDRLQEFEELPPIENWTSIREKLQPSKRQKAPVIPMQPLYPYLIRYGSVAVLIGLVAWFFTANPFWQNTPANTVTVNNPGEPAKNKKLSHPAILTAITGNQAAKADILAEQLTEPGNDLPARDPKYARVHLVETTHLSKTPYNRQHAADHAPILSQQELPVQQRNHRYIIIYSASGEPIRLSAKFAPLYYAMIQEAENNSTNTATSLLRQLQDQMSQRPYIPDPNNHFDMIRLVDLLQQ